MNLCCIIANWRTHNLKIVIRVSRRHVNHAAYRMCVCLFVSDVAGGFQRLEFWFQR